MGISGYIEVKCKKCEEIIDWYFENLPSSDCELLYTCNKCKEKYSGYHFCKSCGTKLSDLISTCPKCDFYDDEM